MLTDASTGAPLAYAYVFLENDQQYGVISNERGEYQILLDSAQLQDRLVFSHHLHWVTSILGGHDNLRFTNRGEYQEGKDTLIRIAYNWDLKASGANAEQMVRLSAYFSGEVLINRTENAILRNTQGNLDKGYFADATYKKTSGKYYLQQLVRGGKFRYDSLQQSHFYQSVIYVTDVITESKAKKSYRKGNRINRELTLEEVRTPYDPNFWARHPMMVKLPAPAALEIGLSRLRSLEEQFRGNARKVKE